MHVRAKVLGPPRIPRGPKARALPGALPGTLPGVGILPRVALVAGVYPCRSETFVAAEVNALRQRGWIVNVVSLHRPEGSLLPTSATNGRGFTSDIPPLVVYERGWWRQAMLEMMCHPLRSLMTCGLAMMDVVWPGEKMSLAARVKLLAQAAAGLSLARRLRPNGVRAIHCHFAHAPTTVGMYAAKQLGLPFSFVGHANDLFQRRALLKRKLQRASFVSCISRWHRDWYASIEPRRGEAYRLIRCGVEVEAWQTPTRRAGGLSEAGGGGLSTKRTVRILCVCRLVPKKGVDVLLDTLAILLRERPGRWRLTVAGDGPEREKLEYQARALGIAGAVRWLGAVPPEVVPKLMAEADLFALLCRRAADGDRDGIPVALMEAMAGGLPVVAGDLSAVRELVEHEHTGLLAPSGDAEAAARALRRLAEDAALRDRLAEAGRARVREEFARPINVDRLEAALREAMVDA